MSDAVNCRSRLLKKAARFVETDRFSPAEAAEIASALGTIEFKHGNVKNGRKLIAKSLVQPTDNVVAQAAWISRKMGFILPVVDRVQSHEASTWKYYEQMQWSVAVYEARLWQGEEPFSSRPAITGSFLASIALWDFGLARTIAEVGLRSNPGDTALLNNLAFAAAMSGDLTRADEAVRSAWALGPTGAQEVALYATNGLLAFRAGRPEDGRQQYTKAMELARALGDRSREARAFAHLAGEEARIGSPGAREMCVQAKKRVDKECGALASLFGRVFGQTVVPPRDQLGAES